MMDFKTSIFFSVLLFFTLLFQGKVSASDTGILELKRVADNNPVADTAQVAAYIQLAKYYLYDSTELSRNFAKRGIKLASSLAFDSGKGQCQNLLALAHEIQGSLDEALQIYEAAYVSLSNANKIEAAAGIIVNMGIAHYYAGDRGKALKYYLRALDFARTNNLIQQEAKLLSNIATIYGELKLYDEAITMYQQSLLLKKDLSDSLGCAKTMQNLGLTYGHLGDGKRATFYLSAAVNWYKMLGQESDAVQASLSLSSIYLKLQKIADAERILLPLIGPGQVRLLPHHRATAYLTQARILQIKGDNVAVLDYLQTGFNLIVASDRNVLLAEYLALFSEVFENMKQFDKALFYTKQRLALLDTLNQKDRLETEREMKAKLEIQEKEAKIVMQQQKLLQQTSERQWFFALLAISFLLLVVLAFFAYSKAKSNISLREKNQIIDRSLTEKEILLKEIHHRVKNNLQVVSSLLSLQARSLKGSEAMEALAKGKDRVRSMALIHQNLYQGENLSGVDTREYIDRLCRSLLNTYHVGAGNIKMTTNIESFVLDIDTVIPLGLILNELITNAIKYAFKPDDLGEISISLTRNDQSLEMVVSDNGIGIPSNQDREQQTMGFRLVKAFVQKLKGSYQITNEQGTKIALRFHPFQLA